MADQNSGRFSFYNMLGFIVGRGAIGGDSHEPPEIVHQRQVTNSRLTFRFVNILGLACVIASLGLLGDSAVTVIGAMLIAPLMKPIMAFAYGITTGKYRIVARSTVSILVGIAVTILVSAGTQFLFQMREPTDQILSRMEPSLIDLGVAIAAGVAASMAVTRPDVADSLPGVAIAVALVPPLCVTGIGLSLGMWPVAIGSLLLFAVNLFAIIVCCGIVFLIDGYGVRRKAIPGILVMLVIVGLLSPPLINSMVRLHVDDDAQAVVDEYIREQYEINGSVHPKDVVHVDTLVHSDHVSIFVEVEAPRGAITETQLDELHRRLADEIDRPLNLKVQISLTEEFMKYDHLIDGKPPLYATNTLVPRR